MLPKAPPKFDLAKLESMTEPFTIRVERVNGNMRHEVPLPASEDGNPPGTSWSKEQVRGVEAWLVNEWSGGGNYAITILDSSQPPFEMAWTAFYNPVEFPAKTPPPLMASSSVSAPMPTYQQQQQRPMTARFNGGFALPQASSYPQPQPQQQGFFPPIPQPTGYPQPMPQQMPYNAPYNPGFDPDKRRLEAQLEQMAAQLAQAREQTASREFERRAAEMKAESERQRLEMKAESDRKFTELQQLIQQMGQNLVKAQPTHDPAIEQLREQNRVLQEAMRAAQAETERQRRESELRDLIRTNQEETRRQLEAANARYELVMRETANKGPDPIILMFQEQMRMQVENMKEMARTNQAQMDRVQANIMRPQDLLQIVKDSSNGADQVQAQMNRAWQDMFQIQRSLIQTAAEMNQGGGNEVIGLVRDIGGGVQKMVEKYTGGKTKEAVAGLHAQSEMARAQAEVIKSNNDRLAAMAQTEARVKQVGPGQPQPVAAQAPVQAPTNGNGNGNGNGHAQTKPPWVAPHTVPAQANGLSGAPIAEAPAPVQAVTGQPRRIKGRTDAEWFGVLLPKVIELRGGVDRLIESLSMNPPRMDPKNPEAPDGVVPEQTAMAVHQAAMYIMEHQIPIPAMIDLLIQGMVPDFIDVLLPDAPQAYRDDVAKLLLSMGAEEPDEDEDDENDEDEDESQPEAQA